MTKIDTNLDAYRMIAEDLARLRTLLRDALTALEGEEGLEGAIPEPVREYLTQRRERETSISWHATDSLDLLDYASYSDLYEIIAATPPALERFASLAPDVSLLRIRFLELQTIFNRVAFVRPVTESEMGFLVSFDERVRKLDSGEASTRARAKEPAREPVKETSASRPRKAEKADTGHGAEEATPAPKPEPVAPPKTETASQLATTPASSKTAGAPRPAGETRSATKPQGRESVTAAPESAPEPAAPPPPKIKLEEATSPAEIERALELDRDSVVLTALYREITTVADGLWSQAAPAATKTWELVRESPWYRRRFAPLGLKPVSDFYALVEAAREQILEGKSRTALQGFLKDRNFAQVLLSLRELFRQHLAA